MFTFTVHQSTNKKGTIAFGACYYDVLSDGRTIARSVDWFKTTDDAAQAAVRAGLVPHGEAQS